MFIKNKMKLMNLLKTWKNYQIGLKEKDIEDFLRENPSKKLKDYKSNFFDEILAWETLEGLVYSSLIIGASYIFDFKEYIPPASTLIGIPAFTVFMRSYQSFKYFYRKNYLN